MPLKTISKSHKIYMTVLLQVGRQNYRRFLGARIIVKWSFLHEAAFSFLLPSISGIKYCAHCVAELACQENPLHPRCTVTRCRVSFFNGACTEIRRCCLPNCARTDTPLDDNNRLSTRGESYPSLLLSYYALIKNGSVVLASRQSECSFSSCRSRSYSSFASNPLGPG